MMKISECTAEFVADYLRLDDPSDIEMSEIKMMMESAYATVQSVTALTDEEIEDKADLIHPYLLIISDMFDNRNAHLDSKATTPNESIMATLKRHAKNYL